MSLPVKAEALQLAGGWLSPTKGGDTYANYFAHRTVYRDDHREKQQPPPGTVAVVITFMQLY